MSVKHPTSMTYIHDDSICWESVGTVSSPGNWPDLKGYTDRGVLTLPLNVVAYSINLGMRTAVQNPASRQEEYRSPLKSAVEEVFERAREEMWNRRIAAGSSTVQPQLLSSFCMAWCARALDTGQADTYIRLELMKDWTDIVERSFDQTTDKGEFLLALGDVSFSVQDGKEFLGYRNMIARLDKNEGGRPLDKPGRMAISMTLGQAAMRLGVDCASITRNHGN